MPFIAKLFLPYLTPYTLLPSVVLSGVIILLPPLFMMGTVSPIIISLIATDEKKTGKISGNVYAISTVGGIISTFLFGFFIIPKYGLTMPSIAVGLLLGVFCALVLIKYKVYLPLGILVLTMLYTGYLSLRQSVNPIVIFEQEGLLGQMIVVDYPEKDSLKRSIGKSRFLFVNRISQTKESPPPQEKYFSYVHDISAITDSFPKTSNMLLIGMGGGSVAKEFAPKGYNITSG
jgi:hypothetical protein